jgi:hypothetical protein
VTHPSAAAAPQPLELLHKRHHTASAGVGGIERTPTPLDPATHREELMRLVELERDVDVFRESERRDRRIRRFREQRRLEVRGKVELQKSVWAPRVTVQLHPLREDGGDGRVRLDGMHNRGVRAERRMRVRVTTRRLVQAKALIHVALCRTNHRTNGMSVDGRRDAVGVAPDQRHVSGWAPGCSGRSRNAEFSTSFNENGEHHAVLRATQSPMACVRLVGHGT